MTQTPGQRTASTVLDRDAAVRALTEFFAPYAAAFAELGRSLDAYFKHVAPTIKVIAEYADRVDQVRKARVRRMHTAYGRRRR